MYRHLLVPLDGSELATHLVSQAVVFAAHLKARVTFFTMRSDFGATQEGALLRTLSPDAYSERSAGDANANIAKAVAAAGAANVVCEGVIRSGSHAWELILEVALERHCDLVFMASHGGKGLKAMVLGSQTRKVLEHSPLPVHVAMVEANVESSPGDEVIRIIKDEHRSIAAVCNCMHITAGALRAGNDYDLDFVQGLVHYTKAFPETLHHPKEERFLFSRLAVRSGESAALIASLEAEHRYGSRALMEIESLIGRCRYETPAPYCELAEALDDFIDAQLRHLGTEESVLIPAALRCLTDDDWREVEAAFRQNDVIGVSRVEAEAFAHLFVRLMNVSSQGKAT